MMEFHLPVVAQVTLDWPFQYYGRMWQVHASQHLASITRNGEPVTLDHQGGWSFVSGDTIIITPTDGQSAYIRGYSETLADVQAAGIATTLEHVELVARHDLSFNAPGTNVNSIDTTRRVGVRFINASSNWLQPYVVRLYGDLDPTKVSLRLRYNNQSYTSGSTNNFTYTFEGSFRVFNTLVQQFRVNGYPNVPPDDVVQLWLESTDAAYNLQVLGVRTLSASWPPMLTLPNMAYLTLFRSGEDTPSDKQTTGGVFTSDDAGNIGLAFEAGQLHLPLLWAQGNDASRPNTQPLNVPRWNSQRGRFEMRKPDGSWVGLAESP